MGSESSHLVRIRLETQIVVYEGKLTFKPSRDSKFAVERLPIEYWEGPE
jgi:hypothetical protein